MKIAATGPVIGVIVRNSTYAQVGNYRSEVQSIDLPKRCEALGYQWQLYDEQGVSGKALSAREQTLRALDDLRHGLIQGIGVLDVKRATRDEDCMDGRIMKRAEKSGDELMLRAVPPPGYQLVVKSFKKNGMPVRVPAKRPHEETLVEELWRLLDELPSLNSVAKRLNQAGMLRPRRRAEGGREWVTPDIGRILQNPLYKGVI